MNALASRSRSLIASIIVVTLLVTAFDLPLTQDGCLGGPPAAIPVLIVGWLVLAALGGAIALWWHGRHGERGPLAAGLVGGLTMAVPALVVAFGALGAAYSACPA